MGLKINESDLLREQRLARLRQVSHNYRQIYSDLDRDQLKERIWEAGRGWDATRDEVSQVMREFYERQ
jgi:hypothetical protein